MQEMQSGNLFQYNGSSVHGLPSGNLQRKGWANGMFEVSSRNLQFVYWRKIKIVVPRMSSWVFPQ